MAVDLSSAGIVFVLCLPLSYITKIGLLDPIYRKFLVD